MLLSLLFNQSNAFGSFRANFAGAIAAMLQVANMHYAINAFSELGMGVTYHFWSLSLEEQFYLALPFMLFFGGRAFAWLAAAIVLAQLLSVRPGGGLVLYAWMFRTDALFLGVLLAWWSRGEVYPLFEPVFLRTRAWARWFTLVFLCVALATVGSDALRIVEYRLSIVAVLAALIVFVASWDRDYLMAPGRHQELLHVAGLALVLGVPVAPAGVLPGARAGIPLRALAGHGIRREPHLAVRRGGRAVAARGERVQFPPGRGAAAPRGHVCRTALDGIRVIRRCGYNAAHFFIRAPAC